MRKRVDNVVSQLVGAFSHSPSRKAHWLPIALCSLGLMAAGASAQTLDCNAESAPERVLVRFQGGAAAAAMDAAHVAAGAIEILKDFHAVDGLQLVRVAPGQEQAAMYLTTAARRETPPAELRPRLSSR